MSRKSEIQNAYKYLGKEATFYDGMITCSTIPGKAVCKVVWNMDKESNTRYFEMVLDGIPENFNGKMLEVPVGTGVLTIPVYKTLPDADITCLDFSTDMMASAQRRATNMGLSNIEFVQGDVGALPFDDESFDLVLSLHVFPGKEAAYNEVLSWADRRKVFLHDADVRDMTCDSLLQNISMVFQNVYLFNDSIRNNIRFGNPEATENEIIAAAKAASCHDFITALPNGYDTIIGEGGGTLSGGEKQRISIARAMLKNAPIVILDEATASIDPENEHLIQQALSELTAGKTVITIAHRLATIEHADQILVVDDGCIVQKGTHNELITQEGLYQKFINIREPAEGWSIA